MISVSHLVKKFGDFTAVNDISFDVAQGEIFAFLGPNGAGKTTTIKMLTTLLRPTSGRIELDGLDPTVKQKQARQRFGIVFQDPSLDDEQTACENMDLHGVLYHVPRKIRAQRTEELLKLFELWDRKDEYVKTFSGGMKRRLEIARGFLHTPKFCFSTSLRWGSTRRAATSSGPTSSDSTRRRRLQSFSPRTTWMRRTASLIALPSWTMEVSWPRALRRS